MTYISVKIASLRQAMQEYPNFIFFILAFSFYGMCMGSLGFFATLWLLEQGASLAMATTLAAVNTIVTIFVVNIFSHYADTREGGRKRIIRFSVLGGATLVLTWPYVDNLYVLYVLYVLGGTITGALIPLLDSIAVQSMPIRKDRKINFTVMRSFMTVGYFLGTIVVGRILDVYGINLLPYVGVALLLIVYASTTILKADFIPHKKTDKKNVWLDLLAIPWIKSFLVINFIYGLGTAFYYCLVSVYFEDLGFSKSQMGIILFFGNVTEVLMFVFGKPIIQRYRPLQLMAFAGFMCAVRWFLLSEFVSFYALSAITLLHAFTYAMYHSSASYFIQRNVPAELSSSAQSAFQASLLFVPFAIGFPLAGYLYPFLQADIFKISTLISLVAMAFAFWISTRKTPSAPIKASGDGKQ